MAQGSLRRGAQCSRSGCIGLRPALIMPKRHIQKSFETFKVHHVNSTQCWLWYLSDKASDESFILRQIYVLSFKSSRFRNAGRGIEIYFSGDFYTILRLRVKKAKSRKSRNGCSISYSQNLVYVTKYCRSA